MAGPRKPKKPKIPKKPAKNLVGAFDVWHWKSGDGKRSGWFRCYDKRTPAMIRELAESMYPVKKITATKWTLDMEIEAKRGKGPASPWYGEHMRDGEL